MRRLVGWKGWWSEEGGEVRVGWRKAGSCEKIKNCKEEGDMKIFNIFP